MGFVQKENRYQNMIVIIDTDGLIASLCSSDLHHEAATKILRVLHEQESKIIYPSTTIVESITLLQGRLNKPTLAKRVLDSVRQGSILIEPVTDVILQKVSGFMDFKKTKHNTLFDAVVAAIAEKHHADAIFSFDKFYQKNGFKLTSELL